MSEIPRVTPEEWRQRRDAVAEKIWQEAHSGWFDSRTLEALVRAHQALSAQEQLVSVETSIYGLEDPSES